MPPHRSPSAEPAGAAAADPSFSVVVAAWSLDATADLETCVAALNAQTLAPREIFVVIDHNTELAAWGREHLTGVTVLENRGDRGIVGARNTGVEAARGELVAFTDDDAAPEPGWLAELAAAFADERTIGVGGALDPEWVGVEPRWFPTEFYWVFGCSYRGLPTEPAPIRNAIGANMAVRREALEAIGGLTAGVRPRELRLGGEVLSAGHALEDTSLGIRIGAAFPEKRWIYQPTARVRHKVVPGRTTFRYLLVRSFEEGESKAALASTVGADSGLEAERRHLFVTVPMGFLRGLGELLRGDPYGPLRSLALIAGIGAASAGYLLAGLRDGRRRDGSSSDLPSSDRT
ncbi:MAG: glycosyltransferase family 2 protein [Actinobacteria bacterium]|nr:glycosyltransferase family 2 protein [Actinomycetota bacterium]